MKGLVVMYLIIAMTCIYEQNGPRVMYWLGAAIITSSVIWGMK